MSAENGTGKVTIDCPACHQRFSGKLPVPEISNSLKSSFAIAVHEKPIKCICGAAFVPIITEVQCGWSVQPISAEIAASLEGSMILEPPPGLKLV